MPLLPSIENSRLTPASTASGHDHGIGEIALNTGTGQTFSAALARAAQATTGGGGSGGKAASHSAEHAAQVGTVNSEGANPRHFPIGGMRQEHGFQETVMALRAFRQHLLASNIANADTPGYKAVDINFQEALSMARSLADTSPLRLTSTAPGHLEGQSQSSVPPYPVKYSVPAQASADGNTVDMDVERAKFTENAVMWEFSRDRVSGHFKMMTELLQSLKN